MNPDVIAPLMGNPARIHLKQHPLPLMVGPKSLGIGGKHRPAPAFSRHLTAADRKFAALYARQSARQFLIGCLVFFDRRLPDNDRPLSTKTSPLGADALTWRSGSAKKDTSYGSPDVSD